MPITTDGVLTWARSFQEVIDQSEGFVEPAWGMCLHTEVGWEHNMGPEFNDPSSQASSFFGVAFDGGVDQFVRLGVGRKAWTQSAGNPHYRGVETEDGGNPSNPWTQAQLGSLGRLAWELSIYDGFPLVRCEHGDRGITTHSFVNGQGDPTWGGHPCPGPVRLGQVQDVIGTALQYAGLAPIGRTEAMGKFNLVATTIDPKVAPDAQGRFPFWGVDAKGETFSFNGARALPSPVRGHDDICDFEYLADRDIIVLFADDGHQENGVWKASTFAIRPAA